MLSQVPIYAVMVEDLGERGAHYMAYKEFCKEMYIPPKTKLMFDEKININIEGEDGYLSSMKSQESDYETDNGLIEYNQNWFKDNTLNLTLFGITIFGAFILGMTSIRKK
jgi:hypothetical protein